MKLIGYFALGLLASFVLPALQAGTFSIVDIKTHVDGSILEEGITKPNAKPMAFIPQIEISVQSSKDLRTKNLYVRAYFFDSTNKLFKSYAAPATAFTIDPNDQSYDYGYQFPSVLTAGRSATAYFPIPDKAPDDWKVLIVFGSKNAAVAAVGGNGDSDDYAYPEKSLVQQTLLNPDKEDDADDVINPLIEKVVQSGNPSYPKFTLFLHLPKGVTNPHDVKGVFALCLLANSVQAIRDSLNQIDPDKDPNSTYAFAESHRFAILAWGGGRGGNAAVNYDEMDKDQLEYSEADFQQIADAWDRGVQELVHDYGIPDHDFLLNGWSSAGEWADRLALHKPERFRAVHIHVASKYDAPNPAGGHVMWLLTSGELDPGNDRSLKFYSDAKAMNFPIVFKSFIGLGHGGSPAVDQLEKRFFEYALSLKRPQSPLNDPAAAPLPLDFAGFDSPPFYGDAVNQEMFPANQKDMIPPGFLVSLPSKDIADAWAKQP